MTKNENGIFLDAMHYLDVFNDPPAVDDPEAGSWWENAADALSALSRKWDEHPLAVQLGIAIYTYIEIKAKAKGGAVHE